jgi:hypothetical protein
LNISLIAVPSSGLAMGPRQENRGKIADMTPFELSLRNELEVERQRFANKWLFPWHQLNVPGKSFTVEDFRGGHISYGGIVFQGQSQQIFWQAIDRYLKGKVHDLFRWWDDETRNYPSEMRASSLGGTTNTLRGFVANVMRNAIDTDQALRGRGAPATDIPHDAWIIGLVIAIAGIAARLFM